jgi:hypothetical protein
MNEINRPDSSSPSVSWSAVDHPLRAPDSSLLAAAEKAPATATALLKSAAQGAHDTIDRVADGAAPAVRQLGASVAAAGETLHAKTEQLRETRDEWMEAARSTVRRNPLACAAAAFGLGVVIARMSRSYRSYR